MKKAIMIVAVVGGLTAMASCKGDHVCSCTVVTTGTINATVTVDTTYTDMKKKDADTECQKGDATVTIGGDTYTSDCELK